MAGRLEVRGSLAQDYQDVLTPEALRVLEALAELDSERKALMAARLARRAERFRTRERIGFLAPEQRIPGTSLLVRDARAGNFSGSAIPHDLERQWIQGTGPAARPGAP